jgi:para-aminobenzoate synthetase/4-amino-4-deoxychorismate lyase
MAAVFDRRRPSLESGVFETMLVLAGRPVELDVHLARLGASLAELFPEREVPALSGATTARSAGMERGALRIAVAPAADGFEVEVVVREAPSPSGPVALHSIALDGGLGPHKWVDRALIEETQALLPADALPLIVDRDGTVLEASRANVFAVRDGALFTPPLDGRILPGVTRARILEIAAVLGLAVHQVGLSREDLHSADEVLLTGSVRGVERARALDGVRLEQKGEVGARLSVELRQAPHPGGSLKSSSLTR